MVAIGTGDGPPDLEAGIRLAEEYPQFVRHGGRASARCGEGGRSTYRRLRELLRHPKVVAVGEIGLDYHYDFSPRGGAARGVRRSKCGSRAEAGKPIVIHTREAWEDTFAMLEEHWAPTSLPASCIASPAGWPRPSGRCDLGFYLSFGGIVTFPKALEVQEAAQGGSARPAAGGDRRAVSGAGADARQTERAGVRGRRRRGGWRSCAGISYEEIAAATTANFRALVGLAPLPRRRVKLEHSMGFSKLGQSLTAREIFDLVHDDLEQVEREIGLESVASVDAVTTISHYLQAGGGKRLRPMLLLLSARLLGERGDAAIRMAAVVEMIHTATLVHDDVIDTAETRRGRPSTNVDLGQSHLRAGRRLAVHAGVPDGAARAQFPDSRSADRPDPDDGGRRAAAAGAHRQDRHHRSRLHGTGGPQDGQPVLGLRAAGRHAARRRAKRPRSGWASTPGTWASRSNWWTTCWISRRARRCSASRWATTCAKGKVTLPLVYALEAGDGRGARTGGDGAAGRQLRARCRSPNSAADRDSTAASSGRKERAQIVHRQGAGDHGEFPDSPYQRALHAVTELVTERDH